MGSSNYDYIEGDSDILDIETLKMLYANLSNTNYVDSRYDYLILLLKNTALKCYNEDEDENLSDVLQRKRYAFELLRIISHDIFTSDEFCLSFYFDVVKILHHITPQLDDAALQNLDEYIITSSIHNKILLLQTLSICLTRNGINLAVFLEYPPTQWRKELLMLALFSGEDNYDGNIVEEVLDNIDTLSLFLRDEKLKLKIEDVLETLVSHQTEFGVDVIFINDFLRVGPHEKEIFQVLRNFVKVKQLVEMFKMKMLIAYCVDAENSLLRTLSPQDLVKLKYLTRYPMKIVLFFCSKIGHSNYKDLMSFVDVLESWEIEETSKVKFLFSLEGAHSLHTCTYKVSFEIVKNIIGCTFPHYATYKRDEKKLQEIKKKVLCKIFSKNSFAIDCSCSEVNGKCKLHRSTDCCDLLYMLNCSLAQAVFNCVNPSENSIQTIKIIINKINTEKRIVQLIKAFDILYEHNFKFTNAELNNFLLSLPVDNYEKKTHEHAVNISFPGSREKTKEEIIEELEHLNPGVACSVVELFISINDAYENKSVLFPNESSIKSWDKGQIAIWARMIKTLSLKVANEEIIAVLKRSAEVTVKLKLRDTQLLSVIVMLKSTKTKGRLAQINTGEGKTLIIAILAAYFVLKGNQVDIYTSSPLLAIPSKDIIKFYELVGSTVSNNILENSGYESDVVYGTNNSFQAGVLLDEFRKTGVRKGRKFGIAIVDEVDNMLIDGNNWILKLSCDMPAMDYLEVILATISIQVNAVASSMIEDETGQVYYLEQEHGIDETGKPKEEVQVKAVPIEGTKVEFITKCTEGHLRKLIRDPNYKEEINKDYPEIKIPKHLKEVVCKVQLDKWIKSAIQAIFYHVKNEDYILRDGKVLIVDASNTGVVKKNSQWGAGLHQFLEIKHGTKVRPESFTTNFVSNVGLFSRYNSIYGLTGTLGSKDAKVFLHTTYDVDSVIIPPFKLRQHKHLEPIILANESDWYLEIAKHSIRNLENGRAVLVIMKYIREIEELARVFEEDLKYDYTKIKLYKTDDHSNVVEKPLRPGDIIITTNIAGRGTDIELTSEVEHNGGLHVCLTFLPINTRVEEQNIGRTSRKGNRGTSQFILHEPECLTIQQLKAIRSRKENRNMTQAAELVKKVKVKDKVFQEFCMLLSEIYERNSYSKKWEQTAVEERFSIWLQMHEDQFDEMGETNVLEMFDCFRREIKGDNSTRKLIKNPYFYVKIGNDYLKDKKFEEAIEEYTQAIILDDDFAEHAYYNRAWAYLSKYGDDLNKYEFYINNAINDLKRARKLINDKEYSLHLLQNASKSDLFSEQVTHKLNLYTIQKNTIEAAIGPDMEEINQQLKKLNKEEADVIDPDDKEQIREIIKYLEKSKENVGVVRKAKENQQSIKIESLADDDFMVKSDRDTHKDEIDEFKRNGWIGSFKVSEVKPIDWTSVICLLGIGLGQLILGAAICIFSLGAGTHIGVGLMSEGVSDIITAIKDGIINRDFNWATWAIQKVISIAITVIFAGLSAIKDVAKTVTAGIRNLTTMSTKVFTQVSKEGFVLVAKRMGLELGKGIAKEIITDLAKYGIDQTLMPIIEEIIINTIKGDIENALVKNSTVEKLLKLDEKNKNRFYENNIKLLAQGILNPGKNHLLMDVVTQIATHVSSHTKLDIYRKIGTALYGMYELKTFTTDFTKKMTSAINKIKIPKEKTNKSNNEGQSLDESKSSGSSKESNPLPETTDEQEVEMYAESAEQPKHNDGDIDLSKLGTEEEQVMSTKPMNHSPCDISKSITEMVSASMLNIIKGKMVSPLIQMGANYTVDKFCAKVHESLESQTKVYRSTKRILSDANNKSKSSKLKEVSLEDLNKANAIIENLRKGGPAGLVHLGAVSEAVGRPIEVYNEKGQLMFPVGTHLKGKPIEIQYQAPKDGKVGHFTLKGNREPGSLSQQNNMCLFNAVAHEANMDPTELKSKTLDIMHEDIATVIKQVKDIRRLELHAHSKLLLGGAMYNGKCPDHARDFLRNSYGRVGHGNPKNPGHPNIHFPLKGKTIDILNAVSEETGKRIEVYDKNGKKSFIVGPDLEGEPIELYINKTKGNSSEEYLSSKGGKEKYNLQNPYDTSFYELVNKHSKNDPETLQKAIMKNIDEKEATSMDYLNGVSENTKKKVEVYDHERKLSYTVGDKYKGEPIKLQKCPPKDGSTGERFSSLGSKEAFHPSEAGFYNMTSAQNLKSAAYDKVNKTPVPGKEQCVENKSNIKPGRSGFRSEDEMAFVLHHVMQTKTAQRGMDQLNNYDKCVNHSEKHYLETISSKTGIKVEVYGDDGNVSYTLGEQCQGPVIKLRNQDLINCNINKAHPANYLNTVSDTMGKKVEVYDIKGKLAYTVGNQHEGKPIKLNLVNPEDYKKKFLVIPAKELKLPRTAYGGWWQWGKLKAIWPVTDVAIMMQHHVNQQTNKKARPQIQTIFPYPPKS